MDLVLGLVMAMGMGRAFVWMSCAVLLLQMQLEKVGGAADAGVPGANEFFAFVGNLLFRELKQGRDPPCQVQFDLALVLGGWGSDFGGDNETGVVDFVTVMNESSGSFRGGETSAAGVLVCCAGGFDFAVSLEDAKCFFEGMEDFEAAGDDGLKWFAAGRFEADVVSDAFGGGAEQVAVETDAGERTDAVGGLLWVSECLQGGAVSDMVFNVDAVEVAGRNAAAG